MDLYITNNDELNDYQLALALQNLENENENLIICTSKREKPDSIVSNDLEFVDPVTNIQELFIDFDKKYFHNTLGSVEVKWSKKMTLCAGVCSYEGKCGLCSIRLSLPILQYRTRKDLIETLLHEMIHAYLFISENNRDRSGHGPNFLFHMNRINKLASCNITVYHNFHEEVRIHRTHVWRCVGLCRNKPPFYGYVRRAMNRAPSRNDYWFNEHEKTCGGSFVKLNDNSNIKPIILKSKDDSSEISKTKEGKKINTLNNYFI